MSWYKITLTPEQNAAAEPLREIVNGFAALLDQKPPPSGAGLFAQNQNSKDYSFSIYFSPACADYCAEFIEQIQATECERPIVLDVTLLLGNPDARTLLDKEMSIPSRGAV